MGVLWPDPPPSDEAAALARCARGVVAPYGAARGGRRGRSSARGGGAHPNRDRAAALSGVRNGSFEGVGAGGSGFRFSPDDEDAGAGGWMARRGGRDAVAASGSAAASEPSAGAFSSASGAAEALAGARRTAPRSLTMPSLEEVDVAAAAVARSMARRRMV